MCELFGFTANKEYDISRLLKAFYSRSIYHPHGWGLAVYRNGLPFIAKEPVPAHESGFLELFTGNPVTTSLAIAHIRYASKGVVSIANTHPFIKRQGNKDWVLAHNGTLRGSLFVDNTTGKTDSEKILFKIALAVRNSNSEKVKEAIEDVLKTITWLGKLNLLFSDGDTLYVFSNRKEKLNYIRLNNIYIFATTPIPLKAKGKWETVPTNTLLGYKNGEEIYHGKKLVEWEEDIYSKEIDDICWWNNDWYLSKIGRVVE